MPPTWCRWLFATLSVVSLHAPVSALTLAEALEALRADGIETVYTQRLVTDAQQVQELPPKGPPRDRLRLLLGPFGLNAKITDDGVFVVVRSRTGVLEGCLSSDPGGQPIAGALVWVDDRDPKDSGSAPDGAVNAARSQTHAGGCYRLLEVPSGARRLHVTRPGYRGESVDIDIPPGGVARVDLNLAIDAQVSDSIFVSTAPEEPPLGAFALSRRELKGSRVSGRDLMTATARTSGAASDIGVGISIRGQDSERLTVVVDGMDLIEPYHLRSLGKLASTVPSGAVDRVEFHRSAPPLAFGNRAGGVLELLTETATSPLGGRVGLASGEDVFEFESRRATLHGTAGRGKLRWLAAYRDGEPSVPSEIGEFDLRPEYEDSLAKVSVAVADRWDLHLQYLGAEDDFSFNRGADDDVQRLILDHSSEQFGLRSFYTAGSRHLVEAVISDADVLRQRLSFETESPTFGASRLIELGFYFVRDLRATHRQRARFEVNSTFRDRFELHWGFGQDHDRTAYDYSSSNVNILTFRPVALERTFEERQSAGFVQGTWRPREHLTVDLGVRVDHSRLRDELTAAPRASVTYRRGPGVWRAAYTEIESSPATFDLQLADGETVLPGSESNRHFALGFVRQTERHLLSVEAYAQRIGNPRLRFVNLYKPISRVPEIEFDRIRLDPFKSRLEGFEIRYEFRGRAFDAGVSYQLSRAEDLLRSSETLFVASNASPATLEGGWFPRREDRTHAVQAWAAVDLPFGLGLYALGTASSGTPTTSFDAPRFEVARFFETIGTYHASRLPDEYRLDLRLTAEFRWRQLTGTLEAGVDDVFDTPRTRGFSFLTLEQDGQIRPELDLGRRFRWGFEISW
ncbi:MAG: TonB-dependent receptor [Acidobacteriota bacterium]